MIKIKYHGQMGNRLFQYSLGRILSTELKFGLQANPIAGFNNTVSYGKRSFFCLFRKPQTLTGHNIDLESILAKKSHRLITLAGYFMRYEFYKKYKETIKKDWLFQAKRFQFGKRDISIHIRSGDLWQVNSPKPVHGGHCALPFSYYRTILEQQKWDNIYIVTEDPDDPMVLKLAEQFSAQVQSSSVADDFNFLMSSTNVVLSVSTFSWWAAWLSDAKTIFFPIAGLFDPSFKPVINLIPDDEPRYQFITFKKQEPWKGTEEQRRQLLNS
jgi:hypothetical protein